MSGTRQNRLLLGSSGEGEALLSQAEIGPPARQAQQAEVSLIGGFGLVFALGLPVGDDLLGQFGPDGHCD